jgi:hypothetical protein
MLISSRTGGRDFCIVRLEPSVQCGLLMKLNKPKDRSDNDDHADNVEDVHSRSPFEVMPRALSG